MKKNLASAMFSSLLIAFFVACSAETEVVEVEKQVVVEKEVVKSSILAETVVTEVVKEVKGSGETIVETVIVEKEVEVEKERKRTSNLLRTIRIIGWSNN